MWKIVPTNEMLGFLCHPNLLAEQGNVVQDGGDVIDQGEETASGHFRKSLCVNEA